MENQVYPPLVVVSILESVRKIRPIKKVVWEKSPICGTLMRKLSSMAL